MDSYKWQIVCTQFFIVQIKISQMTANAALRQETTMVPGVNVFCPFPSTPKFKRLKEELKRNIRDKRVVLPLSITRILGQAIMKLQEG